MYSADKKSSKPKSSVLKTGLKNRLAYTLDYGSLHGFRFLGKRCGPFGRIFWFLIIVISAIYMADILKSTFESFDNEVIINLDTAYLHWNNTFPAISMCFSMGSSSDVISNYLKKYFDDNPDIPKPSNHFKYSKLVQSYMYLSPLNHIDSTRIDKYCKINSTCGVNVDELHHSQLYPNNCSEVITNLKYLGHPYDCNRIFKRIKSEMGHCFTANSIYSHDMDIDSLPLKFDRRHKDRSLSFTYANHSTAQFLLYVHSPEDLPYFNAQSFVMRKNGANLEYLFNIVEIINSPEVENTKISQRQCRFPDERLPNLTLPYSFSSCYFYHRFNVEMEKCNCTLITAPKDYKEFYCNYEGLVCLKQSKITVHTTNLQYNPDTACLQSCLEMEINLVGEIEEDRPGEMGQVAIILPNIPTVRYYRSTERSKLDLVVSVGGVVGLFFGASILSIVEIMYIWLFRRF